MISTARHNDFHKQRGSKKLVWALSVTFVLSYLVGHALTGERGLFVLLKEQKRLEVLRAELDKVSTERKALEHKSQMMRADSLDPDLLDEQARRRLGKAGKDEMVILTPASKSDKQ